ncbi:Aldo/keto reductase family protein [Ferrithrix thermotolerans DSM 19514]|uniref:Aldo/keto reductase family protein n=1 Tax=Ferrithrix thermotolerans DSM 19514 TaxID=1121881 RepID=A0A1M4VXL8_9ACTN|nr:aldo/keto reductase [Ferrithrix thermotolerans]SHE73472.1 Aldo/keto reductase family protein [Ferrithrix thermotolerans DSM 19514]
MIPRAQFGNTGHLSTKIIFGAAGLGSCSQAFADEVFDTLVRYGVNHIDTAASYGNAEERIGPWMKEHRSKFFLATKTEDRNADAARRSLERSLSRLRVDKVDLIQLHNLVEADEWEQVHRTGGALEALVKAKDEGLVDYIGVTGHGTRIPAMHIRSLKEYPYDSVLFPYNYAMMSDSSYREDVEELLVICEKQGVAVQAIKSIARGRWNNTSPDTPHYSWYEPLTHADAIRRAVHYVLSNPQLFLNTSSDYRTLDHILNAASLPISAPANIEMEDDAREFGISRVFDGHDLERI